MYLTLSATCVIVLYTRTVLCEAEPISKYGKEHQPVLYFNLIYLFMSRHEAHSMNTHTLQTTGR